MCDKHTNPGLCLSALFIYRVANWLEMGIDGGNENNVKSTVFKEGFVAFTGTEELVSQNSHHIKSRLKALFFNAPFPLCYFCKVRSGPACDIFTTWVLNIY